MAKYQYGCLKAEHGEMDPSTGVVSNFQEFEIYQDTITLDEPEATRTDHFKQGNSAAPKVTRFGNTVTAVNFTVMDMEADSKVRWLGGSKTSVAEAGVATVGTIVAGSGYTNGTYLNVPLTGGTGSGATANITVAGGEVTAVVIVDAGAGYTASDTLSASAAILGGGGTGFTVPVATVTATMKNSWHKPKAPVRKIDRALRFHLEDGSVIVIPNAGCAGRLSSNLNQTDIAGMPVVATVQDTGLPNVSDMTWDD